MMPPVAPVASTTVSTIARSSWSTSCVAAKASPKRAVVSRRRPRSASSSARRASSWSAISLKAIPRRANSSVPWTGTRWSRRPRATAFAASASLPRVTTIEPPTMYATKPIRISDPRIPRNSRLSAELTAPSIPCWGASSTSATLPAFCWGLVATVRYRLPSTTTVRARSRGTRCLPTSAAGPAATESLTTTTRLSRGARPARSRSIETVVELSGTPMKMVPSTRPSRPVTTTRDVGLVINFDSVSSPLGHWVLLVSGERALERHAQTRLAAHGLDVQVRTEITPFSDHFPFK